MKKSISKIYFPVTLLLLFGIIFMSIGATTADVTITVTPALIEVSDNVSSIDFGTLNVGATSNTSTDFVGITNTSNIQTDQTIAVTGNTWTGGATPWTHSDTATAGADTAGLYSNRGGTWGSGDVIVKYSSPNYIYEDCPATTDYDYGLSMIMPTSSTVYDQKTNTVRIEAGAG